MTTAATGTASEPTHVAWADGDLVLTRVFAAPRELVFRAWTEREHFTRWFGPKESTMPFCRMDARPGGALHFQHHHPGYEDVWAAGVYHEVAAPERIVLVMWFSDAEGSRVERPGFPREMTFTVTLAEHPEGTRMTIRHAGLERDQGEVQGWTEGLDRLAGLLAGA